MNSIKQIEVIYANHIVGRLALTKRDFVHLNIQQSGLHLDSPFLHLNYLCAVVYSLPSHDLLMADLEYLMTVFQMVGDCSSSIDIYSNKA